MKKESISLKKTHLFSQLISDFIDFEPEIKPLVKSFFNSGSLKSILKTLPKIKNQSRKILVNVLNEQYEQTCFFDSNLSIVENNISKLSNSTTYSITTGHQLHIFASPLFLIYKIISVISLSNYLNKIIDECHFVPCFWMATEDHDFEEIRHLNLYNKRYTWDLITQDAVGNLSSKSLLLLINKMESIISNTKYGRDLFNLYKYSYTKNLNYANATRSLLTGLFSEYGLVIIDGNHLKLKNIFKPDFQAEINDGFVFNSVSKTNKLISKKYNPEINPMKSNIFYLSKSIRSKLRFDKNIYFTNKHNTNWSKSELLNEIEQHPEKFSPNVFLRTLYQERILPNMIYVGGPSEISYWLQLKGMFEERKLSYPILSLRLFFLILSKSQSLLQSKLDLTNTDLFSSKQQQIKKIIQNNTSIKLDEYFLDLNNLLFGVKKKLENINQFPINSFHVFEKRFQKEFSRLESKIIKFEKTKNEKLLTQFIAMNNKLFPDNFPQERTVSFIPYYMKYGKNFFQLLIEESSPFDNKYTILKEVV